MEAISLFSSVEIISDLGVLVPDSWRVADFHSSTSCPWFSTYSALWSICRNDFCYLCCLSTWPWKWSRISYHQSRANFTKSTSRGMRMSGEAHKDIGSHTCARKAAFAVNHSITQWSVGCVCDHAPFLSLWFTWLSTHFVSLWWLSPYHHPLLSLNVDNQLVSFVLQHPLCRHRGIHRPFFPMLCPRAGSTLERAFWSLRSVSQCKYKPLMTICDG